MDTVAYSDMVCGEGLSQQFRDSPWPHRPHPVNENNRAEEAVVCLFIIATRNCTLVLSFIILYYLPLGQRRSLIG